MQKAALHLFVAVLIWSGVVSDLDIVLGSPVDMPVTGTGPSVPSIDRIVLALLSQWDVPGAAIGVMKGERLVYARGYGFADQECKQPVQPDSLFRIASISKPITAAAILKLWEEGRLDLGDKVCDILSSLIAPDVVSDRRFCDITVAQLLYHSGGWDRDISPDPMFNSWVVAIEVGALPPATSEDIVRYMAGKQLDFAPGTRYAYSNFGYCLLGRIIEEVTGQKYERYVKEQILEPLGIRDMQIGSTLFVKRAPKEVRYYDYPNAPLVVSVFPNVGKVPRPYGGFYIEAMDSHGGWIASVVDLLRFLAGVDGRPEIPDLLQPETVKLMTSRPEPPLWVGSPYYYAMGWLVRPTGSDATWWHDGSLPGTFGLLVRAYNGFSWAILFNSRPLHWIKFQREVDDALWQVIAEVQDWPGENLFPHYLGTP